MIHDKIYSSLIELNTSDLQRESTLPIWVQLIPAGPHIEGIDGRSFVMRDPQVIVDAFHERGIDLPIDIEHATQIRAENGDPAPAVGWINAIEVRAGSLWGRVSWNDEGRYWLESKSYRYLSPAFVIDAKTKEIERLISAGLTNNPNLDLIALNRVQPSKETFHMSSQLDETICAALGLDGKASAQDVVAAITQMQSERDAALNSAEAPSLERFVPRAEYDELSKRLKTIEEHHAQNHDAAINSAVDGAISAGKVSPGQREFYVATCQAEGGLERFKEFAANAVNIVPESGLEGKATQTHAALSDVEVSMCRDLGVSQEAFMKRKEQGETQ